MEVIGTMRRRRDLEEGLPVSADRYRAPFLPSSLLTIFANANSFTFFSNSSFLPLSSLLKCIGLGFVSVVREGGGLYRTEDEVDKAAD